MTPLASHLAGPDRQVLVVQLPGRVTDEQVGAIREEVFARLPRCQGAGLVLDFSGVDFINSIGITCLLGVEEVCKERGAGLRACGASAGVQQFLKQLRLTSRFPMSASMDEAVGGLVG